MVVSLCIRCKRQIIALLYLYAIAIVARAIVGETTMWRHIDTSILRHAFISIFIALWAVITHYISILMAILSYFTRFTMKRENAGSWYSGWKSRKYWKPILHSSKNPETPRKLFLEIIKNTERRKYQRGTTPWPRGWGHAHPYWAHPLPRGPLVALRCPSSAIWSLLPWKKS